MIDAILRWSLGHRAIVLLLAAALLVWGSVTAYRMPVDVFPDLTAPTVTVLTEGHGMAPEPYRSRQQDSEGARDREAIRGWNPAREVQGNSCEGQGEI